MKRGQITIKGFFRPSVKSLNVITPTPGWPLKKLTLKGDFNREKKGKKKMKTK